MNLPATPEDLEIVDFPVSEHRGRCMHDLMDLLMGGYEPIPICGKAPMWPAWQKMDMTREVLEEVLSRHPDHMNVGLRTGKLVAVDNDLRDPIHAQIISLAIERELGATPLHRVGRKGEALCFFNPEPIGKITISCQAEGSSERITLVEFLGRGQQIAAYGVHPDTGQPYDWPNTGSEGDPLGTFIEDLPWVSPDRLVACAKALANILTCLGYPDIQISGHGQTEPGEGTPNVSYWRVTAHELEEMFRHIEPGCDRQSWIKMAGAMKATTVYDPITQEIDDNFDGEDFFIRWSSGELTAKGEEPSNYGGRHDCENTWATLEANKPGGATLRSIIQSARRGGYTGQPSADVEFLLGPPPEFEKASEQAPRETTPHQPEPTTQICDESPNRWSKLFYRGDMIDEIRPPETIIPGWIPARGVTALLASRGVGKTVVSVDLALRLATDKRWCGEPAKKGFHVVYLCGEDQENTAGHIKAWALKYNDGIVPERFIFVDDVPDLLNAVDCDALVQQIGQEIPNGTRVVWVLDTWQRGTARAKSGQNADEDMQPAFKALEKLGRAFDGPVIGCFHPPKTNRGTIHGSTVIENMTAAIWELVEDEAGKKLEVTRIKGRGLGNYKRFRFEERGLGVMDEYDRELSGAVSIHVGGTLSGEHKSPADWLDDERVAREREAVYAVVTGFLKSGSRVINHNNGRSSAIQPDGIRGILEEKHKIHLTKRQIRSHLTALEECSRLRYREADKRKHIDASYVIPEDADGTRTTSLDSDKGA